jgi:hypothetical protein
MLWQTNLDLPFFAIVFFYFLEETISDLVHVYSCYLFLLPFVNTMWLVPIVLKMVLQYVFLWQVAKAQLVIFFQV